MTRIVIVIVLGLGRFAGAAGGPDLIAAAQRGDLAKVKSLLDGGAAVNFKAADGSTPLGNAFLQPEITQLLLDRGAKPQLADYHEVLQAANYYSIEVLKLLLAAKADPNQPALLDRDAAVRAAIERQKRAGGPAVVI